MRLDGDAELKRLRQIADDEFATTAAAINAARRAARWRTPAHRRADKMAELTKGRFGFHRGVEPFPAAGYVQIYVKSSALSRAPDLAISAHLTTDAEVDEFVDDALVELEEIRIDAKKALAAADSK